jgi:two-component system chemotaxis response regulator CheB
MTRAFDLVVMGGSAGAIDVLRAILSRLPVDFPAAVAVVIHIPAHGPGLLPEVLTTPGAPRMKVAEDKEPILPGTIYFAPPDYHLLVESGRTFALSLDERVHFSRPAIDVLFESAAAAYGDRVAGVILSGANADGSQGLRAIAAAGGMTVIQSLESSEMIAMPAAALQAAPDSFEVGVGGIAELLRRGSEVQSA